MTASPDGTRRTVATLGRIVFLVCLVVGLLLAVVAGWGLLQLRGEGTGDGQDTPLVDNRGVVAMTEGGERRLYVDGPSLPEAECTVTAPDGTVRTLEGYDPVGAARLGKRALGDFTAQQDGDHQVECTGVQEASIGGESEAGRRGAVAAGGVAGVLLLVVVLPAGLISLVAWRIARRGAL